MAEDSGNKKITISVKTPKDKKSIEIAEDAEIKEVSIDDIFLLLPVGFSV